MPHIHTQPDQHDMTVSAYIVLRGQGDDKLLVHMHLKYGKLLQIGGHIELNETPWQAVAHELKEEAGYDVSELKVLQPTSRIPRIDNTVVHPVPFFVNTHLIGENHFHSDLCYAFTAQALPRSRPADGESLDLRYVTKEELNELASKGEAVQDSTDMYNHLLANLNDYHEIDCSLYSLKKPQSSNLKNVG